MKPGFVVDCSVAMTWLFRDEATPQTAELQDRLEREAAVVPVLWRIELANVIAGAERRGRVTKAEVEHFIADLSELEFDIDAEGGDRAFTDLLPLCRTHQLTSYDATYLELAVRRQLPLATLDQSLAKAARKLGVAVLGKK